jgi:hypothetical protein
MPLVDDILAGLATGLIGGISSGLLRIRAHWSYYRFSSTDATSTSRRGCA